MAAAIDSPFVDTRTDSDNIVGRDGDSRDGGRAPSRFHGPGESLESNGEGRGVTSPMADITGLGTVELAADAEPKALARAEVLKLGVLDTGFRFVADVLR